MAQTLQGVIGKVGTSKSESAAYPALPANASYKVEKQNGSIQYWSKNEWTKGKKNPNTIMGPVKELGFLQNAEGIFADSDRILVMNQYAHELWSKLVVAKISPEHWGDRHPQALKFFVSHMMAPFEEFHLGDLHWKANTFATIKYPDFKKKRQSLLRTINGMFHSS